MFLNWTRQPELSDILRLAKKFLLGAISLAPPTALSSSQLRQVDGEKSAQRALRHHNIV